MITFPVTRHIAKTPGQVTRSKDKGLSWRTRRRNAPLARRSSPHEFLSCRAVAGAQVFIDWKNSPLVLV